MGLVLLRQLFGGTEDAENLREFSRCTLLNTMVANRWWYVPITTALLNPLFQKVPHRDDYTLGIYTRRADTIGSRQSIVYHLLLSRKHGYRE